MSVQSAATMRATPRKIARIWRKVQLGFIEERDTGGVWKVSVDRNLFYRRTITACEELPSLRSPDPLKGRREPRNLTLDGIWSSVFDSGGKRFGREQALCLTVQP
jgi:hypothetical protein